jgi:hypothetical protein
MQLFGDLDILSFCFLDRAFSMIKTKMNQQNAQINFWINFIVQSLQHA